MNVKTNDKTEELWTNTQKLLKEQGGAILHLMLTRCCQTIQIGLLLKFFQNSQRASERMLEGIVSIIKQNKKK